MAIEKDATGNPLEKQTDLKEMLKSAPNFLDLQGEEIPQNTASEAAHVPMSPSGLPEAIPGAETAPDQLSPPPPLLAGNMPTMNSASKLLYLTGQGMSWSLRMMG